MMNRLSLYLAAALILMVLLGAPSAIYAEPQTNSGASLAKGGSFYLQTSLFTYHWHKNPDHNNQQGLTGIEYERGDELYGMVWFDNSFARPCWYVYTGKRYDLWRPNSVLTVRGKLTAGIIRGYGGEPDNLFNRLGTFPAVLPTIGVEYQRLGVDLALFGNAGYMFLIGWQF